MILSNLFAIVGFVSVIASLAFAYYGPFVAAGSALSALGVSLILLGFVRLFHLLEAIERNTRVVADFMRRTADEG
jgi:hypothetical protein